MVGELRSRRKRIFFVGVQLVDGKTSKNMFSKSVSGCATFEQVALLVAWSWALNILA
jgi:hypothetical protein